MKQPALPLGFAASDAVADYIDTLQPAPDCPKCGNPRGRDNHWNVTLHLESVTQTCPERLTQ